MVLALEGIKVLEVVQIAAGPMAGRLLGDFGANVIHVEHPVRGDAMRFTQSWAGGPGKGTPHKVNYAWDNTNRNKRSVTLDLSQEAGRSILHKLVERTDVFLTNVKLPDVQKFAIDYQTLNKLNPRLIYAYLNAFGKTGPDKDLPGYEFSGYFARSGISHMLARPEGPPPIPPAGIGDFIAGLNLALGIVTALLVRERTGMGQEIAVSLYSTAVFSLSWTLSEALTTGCEAKRYKRNEVPNPLNANYYKTRDGRWIALSMLQPDQYWSKFCKALVSRQPNN